MIALSEMRNMCLSWSVSVSMPRLFSMSEYLILDVLERQRKNIISIQTRVTYGTHMLFGHILYAD